MADAAPHAPVRPVVMYEELAKQKVCTLRKRASQTCALSATTGSFDKSTASGGVAAARELTQRRSHKLHELPHMIQVTQPRHLHPQIDGPETHRL